MSPSDKPCQCPCHASHPELHCLACAPKPAEPWVAPINAAQAEHTRFMQAPPTPAAMLGEAVELFRRAEYLIGMAGHSGFAGEASAFRTVVERLKREAEAREGKG